MSKWSRGQTTRADYLIKKYEMIEDDPGPTQDGNKEKKTRLNVDKAENNRAKDLTSRLNGYRPSHSR